jgi:hypothetical protein
MYMNCAAVTVTNGGSGLTGPTPFVANANVNECKTIENIDVVFPEPGSVIQYGGSYASSKPTTPAGFSGSNCVGPGASLSPPKASSSATPTKTSAPQTTTAATTMPVVNEHVVSTSTVLPSTSDVATSSVQGVSSTGTASASAVTSTTTSKNGKVSRVSLQRSAYAHSKSPLDIGQSLPKKVEAEPGDPALAYGRGPWFCLGGCLVTSRKIFSE